MADPLLLNIVTDQSRLEVSGLDLDVLTDIVGNSQRQLELTGVRDAEGRAGRAAARPGGEGRDDRDEEDGERRAPSGATLRPTTDKPLPARRPSCCAACPMSPAGRTRSGPSGRVRTI